MHVAALPETHLKLVFLHVPLLSQASSDVAPNASVLTGDIRTVAAEHFRAGVQFASWSVNTDWRISLNQEPTPIDEALVLTARDEFRFALQLFPFWPRAHAYLALVCRELPPVNLSCGRKHLAIALHQDPEDEMALLLHAILLARLQPVVATCEGLCELALATTADAHQYRETLRRQVVRVLRFMLTLKPSSAEALLALGAQLTGTDEAVHCLQLAVAWARNSRFVVNFAVSELRFFGHVQIASDMLAKAVAAGLWQSKYQRPLTYWPGLRYTGFPAAPEFQAMANLFMQSLREVREEVVQQFGNLKLGGASGSRICGRGSICQRHTGGILPQRMRYTGTWKNWRVYDSPGSGVGAFSGRGKCKKDFVPFTCSLLEGMVQAGFNLLVAELSMVQGPESMIYWHQQPIQGVLRMTCSLHIPKGAESILEVGNVSREHKSGQCFWFDDAVEHRLTYTGSEGSGSRYVLLVDVANPDIRSNGEPEVTHQLFSEAYWATTWLTAQKTRGVLRKLWKDQKSV